MTKRKQYFETSLLSPALPPLPYTALQGEQGAHPNYGTQSNVLIGNRCIQPEQPPQDSNPRVSVPLGGPLVPAILKPVQYVPTVHYRLGTSGSSLIPSQVYG